jgi:hypothetical protein
MWSAPIWEPKVPTGDLGEGHTMNGLVETNSLSPLLPGATDKIKAKNAQAGVGAEEEHEGCAVAGRLGAAQAQDPRTRAFFSGARCPQEQPALRLTFRGTCGWQSEVRPRPGPAAQSHPKTTYECWGLQSTTGPGHGCTATNSLAMHTGARVCSPHPPACYGTWALMESPSAKPQYQRVPARSPGKVPLGG